MLVVNLQTSTMEERARTIWAAKDIGISVAVGSEAMHIYEYLELHAVQDPAGNIVTHIDLHELAALMGLHLMVMDRCLYALIRYGLIEQPEPEPSFTIGREGSLFLVDLVEQVEAALREHGIKDLHPDATTIDECEDLAIRPHIASRVLTGETGPVEWAQALVGI